jgi:hypothetical protein
MIKCKSKNGFDVWVSTTYDCGPNVGGYFCQVYLDENGDIEVDNFVISSDTVDSIKDDRKYIIELMSNTCIDAIVEWCPECCDEVVLLHDFDVQMCPSCGRPILPCSLCVDCLGWDSGCPLRYKYDILTK